MTRGERFAKYILARLNLLGNRISAPLILA